MEQRGKEFIEEFMKDSKEPLNVLIESLMKELTKENNEEFDKFLETLSVIIEKEMFSETKMFPENQ